jgi:hypothetical protein
MRLCLAHADKGVEFVLVAVTGEPDSNHLIYLPCDAVMALRHGGVF